MKFIIIPLIVCTLGCEMMRPKPTKTASHQKVALVESFNIEPSEWDELKTRAERGDVASASRLGHYFAFALMDEGEALKYYKIAAKNGGEKERQTLKSYEETKAEQ